MAKRLRQRLKINGEIKWVTGYSHQELLENCALYREISKLQMGEGAVS